MKLNLKFRILKDVAQTLSIQSRLGTRKRLFYLAVISSSVVTYAQLQMIMFLNPLLKGIIASDFSEVRQMAIFQFVEKLWGRAIIGNGKLLIFVSVCVYLITLLRAGFQYLASVAMGRYSHQIAKSLRHFIFQRYLDFGKAYFDRRNIGELIAIMAGSVKSFSNQMNQLQGMLIAGFLVCLYFGLLLKISWKMTLVVCLVVPIFNRANRRLGHKIRELAKSRVSAEKKFGAKLNEVLNGLVIVKGFNKEQEEADVFKENSDRELNLHWSTLRWEALLGPVHEISSTTTFLFIAFALSTLGVIEHVGPTSLFIFFYVVQQFIPAFGRLQQHQIEFDKSTDWNDELKEIFDDLEKHKVPEGGRQLEHFKKEILVQNLSFSYLDNKPVIDGLTCTFPKGKDIALVGPTGSGKSTLLNLLLRLYDCPSDSIFLDGFDIRDYEIASLRNKMAFVSQDVFLFDAPVMYNLTYGLQEKVSFERVMEISHQTLVHEFVKSLPEGYDSFVGERGCKLSGGQRQRIALARALLREAEIILLDEPTSALDVRTENEVVESVKNRLKGKTVITIAHRLSTIQNADFVVFLEKGKIKGQGKFDELVSTNRHFADFVGTEFKKAG